MDSEIEKILVSHEQGLTLQVKVVPGSSRTMLCGIKDSCLRIKIAAAPEDGKANAELLSFLAKQIGCSKSSLSLLRGQTSRVKTIFLPSTCETAVRDILHAQT